MDKHFAAFKASNRAILSSLAWEDAPAPVLRGTDVFRLYRASIPAGHRFWDLWRVNRVALEERGFRMRSSFPEGWFLELLIPDPEAGRQLLDDSAATQSDLEVPAPAGLAYYPFQRAGIEFLETHPQALLADDPGCGKGIQITGLLDLRPEIRSVLIICPACMKLAWRQELEKWLCLPFEAEYASISRDNRTEAMAELYRVCYAAHPDQWINKQPIYDCVHDAAFPPEQVDKDEQGRAEDFNDTLRFFGPLKKTGDLAADKEVVGNQTRLGKVLSIFKNRALGGIRLEVESIENHTERRRYRFVPNPGPCDMVRYAMEDAFIEMFGTEVPVEVEAKVCANWGEK